MTITDRQIQSDSVALNEARFGLIQRLADNKYWLGRRYAEWCTAAPTLESAVAASAMAQDEIGHARSHYPLFRQFVGEDVEPEGRKLFHSMAALDREFDSWMDFVAANVLIDTALTIVYEAAVDSSYVDLRNRARRIVGEEQIHWLHAVGWVRRLQSISPATRRALQRCLQRQWQEAIMWFGRSGNESSAYLVKSETLNKDADEMRLAFRQRIGVAASQLLDTQFSETEPPWDRWDDVRYRLRQP